MAIFESSFNRREFLRGAAAVSGLLAVPPLRHVAAQTAPNGTLPMARGVVFRDNTGQGRRTNDAPGLAGVRVSNGRDVVTTDAQGRYELPVVEGDIVFVQKPSGYRVARDGRNLPRFYYVHQPKGSPADFKYAGVAPTGPLPASLDFPLVPQAEPDKFRVLLFGDPQPRNLQEVDYLSRDVVQELAGVEAAFGVSLGDNVFDDLSVMEPLSDVTAQLGLPWHSVVGNHDLNHDAAENALATETFKRHFGPPYYSFDYGPAHFIVLNNVVWLGKDAALRGGNYTGGFGAAQLTWLKNDLALVPRNKLTVIFMHIPLAMPADVPFVSAAGKPPRFIEDDKRAFLALLQDRPHTLSVSAHTHLQYHAFLGREDGWNGAAPHHHYNCGTTSGSWWSGSFDESGIPHTTMRDGTPNGYAFLECAGSEYAIRWQVARRSASYQMNVHLPAQIEAKQTAQTPVVVNFFNGCERSKLEMRLSKNSAWLPMQRQAGHDPGFVALKATEAKIASFKPVGEKPPWRALPSIEATPHLWHATLPQLAPGIYDLQVRATDMWGKVHAEQRLLRIV